MLDKPIAFAMITEVARATAFYRDVMGFRFVRDDGFSVVFDAHGCQLRLAKAKEFVAAKHTVLGWEVTDIHAEIAALVARGAKFEQFGLAFMTQDEHGVWTTPDGNQVAWFKDPDGNVLSLSTH